MRIVVSTVVPRHVGKALPGEVKGQRHASADRRAPSRSARRSRVAAKRASTGSTASDFTESWAARSRRPIMSAISLMNDGWRSASASIGVGRDLEHDGGLGGLGGRRIGSLLDDRHAAEDLAGPQQLEHDVLARPGMPDDLHAAGPDHAEPARGIALHEDVLARAVGLLDGDAR